MIRICFQPKCQCTREKSSLRVINKYIWAINVFGSVEVENVTATPATSKYWDQLYELIKFFLSILCDFYKFY